MKIHRIKATTLHSWYHFTHSVESWIDILWFSFIDIIVFGFISLYFAREGGSDVVPIIMGIVFWEVVRVAQYSVAVSSLWEIWSRSFNTLFVAPLTLQEYFAAQLISSAIKSTIVFFLTAILGMLFYHVSVFVLGWMIIVYFVSFFLFACAVGFFALALIIRFGTTIQSFAWSAIFLFAPIGAFYYPVRVLPTVLQIVTKAFPFVYINEAMRLHYATGYIDWTMIGVSYAMGISYFIACYQFLTWAFYQSKNRGTFTRLDG